MQRKDPKFSFIARRNPSLKFDLNAKIAQYLDVKRIEKRSPRTIEAYAHTLHQFSKWYASKESPAIDTELLRSYIEYLTFEKTKWDDHPTNVSGTKGLSARSVNNTVRNMRIFFNYLVRERVITYSPMDAVSYQTQPEADFELFTDRDVERLLSAPNRRVYTGRRDYCMMLVMIDCGLRIKELVNLRASDVNLRNRQIIVRAENAKNNTTRIVPISPKTAKELEQLMSYMDVGEDDFLWLTQFGERYFGDSFAKLLKIYAKRAGVVGPRVSPHTFRHYFAVKYLRQGGDLIALSRILGHSSLDVTKIYVRYVDEDLQEQHDKASPVSGLIDKGNEKKRGKRLFK